MAKKKTQNNHKETYNVHTDIRASKNIILSLSLSVFVQPLFLGPETCCLIIDGLRRKSDEWISE